MSDAERQVVGGWLFPSDVRIPEPGDDAGFWIRDRNGNWFPKADGIIDVARQVGADIQEPEIVHIGARVIERSTDGGTDTKDEMPFVAVRAEVWAPDGEFHAIGSTDASTNGLEDMISTAETRALKRAICRALNIRAAGNPAGTEAEPEPTPDQPEPSDLPSGADPDPPDLGGDW